VDLLGACRETGGHGGIWRCLIEFGRCRRKRFSNGAKTDWDRRWPSATTCESSGAHGTRCPAGVYREIEEKYPNPMPTEDQKQKYFEEGYDQCFREVIDEIKSWNHPDTKSFIMWLSKTFKSSAAKL